MLPFVLRPFISQDTFEIQPDQTHFHFSPDLRFSLPIGVSKSSLTRHWLLLIFLEPILPNHLAKPSSCANGYIGSFSHSAFFHLWQAKMEYKPTEDRQDTEEVPCECSCWEEICVVAAVVAVLTAADGNNNNNKTTKLEAFVGGKHVFIFLLAAFRQRRCIGDKSEASALMCLFRRISPSHSKFFILFEDTSCGVLASRLHEAFLKAMLSSSVHTHTHTNPTHRLCAFEAPNSSHSLGWHILLLNCVSPHWLFLDAFRHTLILCFAVCRASEYAQGLLPACCWAQSLLSSLWCFSAGSHLRNLAIPGPHAGQLSY